jgi:threonine dehydrogenase-like Zn-dependent dehydrogenase
MRAAVFKGEGVLELEERPVPSVVDPGDVVLEVGGVGVCGSDLHILDVPPRHAAKPGVIMGHEFAGTVVEVGREVTNVRVGQRVAVDPNPPCGRCENCRRGLPNFCVPLFNNPATDPGWPYTPGQWWDGAMARYVRVPAYFTYPISDAVPFWQAAVAEPLGCVLNGIEKAKPVVGERAVVFGAGPIGLFFVALLRLAGVSQIVVSEPAEVRRQVAETCGATLATDATGEAFVEAVRSLTSGRGADIVIDAVGHLFPQAIEVAAPAARVILLGVDSSASVTITPLALTSRELRVYGVFLMKNTMSRAVQLLEDGVLPMDRIVTHRLPLSQVHDGIALARAGEAVKVVCHPDEHDT